MTKRALPLLALALAATVSAQPATRRATNIAALIAYPGFYHLRQIVIAGTVAVKDDRLLVSDDSGSIHLVSMDSAPEGDDEVRGEFWDLGRMKPDDPQLAGRDLRAAFGIDTDGPWPRPGETLAIVAAAIAPSSPPATTSVRGITLHPSIYRDQKVTVTGQFSGRNLLGELPEAPGRSRYDFVLRTADAALWVSNIQPKAKDAGGRDVELRLDARTDTNRWVKVSGRVQQRRGLLWVEADAGSFSLTRPPSVAPGDDPIRVAPFPPPEVLFSAPTDEETGVPVSTSVRIQFSRDVDPATFKDQVRVSYVVAQAAEPSDSPAPAIEFTTQYAPTNRVMEVQFTQPLERFRTVKVQLLEGILGTDKQAIKPWTLVFSLGGT